jgi:hypothetical protein
MLTQISDRDSVAQCHIAPNCQYLDDVNNLYDEGDKYELRLIFHFNSYHLGINILHLSLSININRAIDRYHHARSARLLSHNSERGI